MEQALKEFIYSRSDEVAEGVACTEGFKKADNEFYSILKTLRAKLPSEDSALVGRLEEVNSNMLGIVESEFYLAGLRDGVNFKQSILGGEELIHAVAS